jgi:SAM-dependent methyltransferase
MRSALQGISGFQQAGASRTALDLACGHGRHTRLLLDMGYEVTAVDRDAAALASCPDSAERLQMDLEGDVWPLLGQRFDVVLVCHYLWRNQWDAMLDCVADGGVLLYETFMQGHETYGSPRNPSFLLEPGELLRRCQPNFEILRFEQGLRQQPGPAVVQRIVARRVGTSTALALQSAHTLSA